MLKFLAESPWANEIGWLLIHSLWQFALVAVLAFVLQRVLDRRSAAARYGALLAAILVMVALPVVTWFSSRSIDVSVANAPSSSAMQPAHFSPSQRAERQDGITAVLSGSLAEPASKPEVESPSFAAGTSGIAARLAMLQTHLQPWLPHIVMVWLAGVLVAALRPLFGWYMVHRLRTVGVSTVGNAVQNVLLRSAVSCALLEQLTCCNRR